MWSYRPRAKEDSRSGSLPLLMGTESLWGELWRLVAQLLATLEMESCHLLPKLVLFYFNLGPSGLHLDEIYPSVYNVDDFPPLCPAG